MSNFLQVVQWILMTSLICILSLVISTISIRMSKIFWEIDLIDEVRKKNNSAALVLLGLLLMIGSILGFALLGIQQA